MKIADHCFELSNRVERDIGGAVVVFRGEIIERVVAPVVGQSFFDEMPIVQTIMHGQELDGRDAKLLQMFEYRIGPQPCVSATNLLRHFRM